MELVNVIDSLSERELFVGVLAVLNHESDYRVLEEVDDEI